MITLEYRESVPDGHIVGRRFGPGLDPGERALPIWIDRAARLVKIDEQRGVIGWDGRALACLAVDLGVDDARGHGR